MSDSTIFAACFIGRLTGGVFDGNFCLWPAKLDHPSETGHFFEEIRANGRILDEVNMPGLDGGAGV